MSFQSWMLWPDNVAASVLLLALLAMGLMYAARRPTHELLRVLEEIKRSVSAIHDKAIGEYRKAYETRHKILEGFMPFWRSVDKNLAQVEKNLAGLQSSVKSVDAHMAKYESINAGTDKAQHALTVSAFTQFAIALVVMAIAAGGAFINFKPIALPMSEMVGAGDYITSSLRTSEVAALVLILVE